MSTEQQQIQLYISLESPAQQSCTSLNFDTYYDHLLRAVEIPIIQFLEQLHNEAAVRVQNNSAATPREFQMLLREFVRNPSEQRQQVFLEHLRSGKHSIEHLGTIALLTVRTLAQSLASQDYELVALAQTQCDTARFYVQTGMTYAKLFLDAVAEAARQMDRNPTCFSRRVRSKEYLENRATVRTQVAASLRASINDIAIKAYVSLRQHVAERTLKTTAAAGALQEQRNATLRGATLPPTLPSTTAVAPTLPSTLVAPMSNNKVPQPTTTIMMLDQPWAPATAAVAPPATGALPPTNATAAAATTAAAAAAAAAPAAPGATTSTLAVGQANNGLALPEVAPGTEWHSIASPPNTPPPPTAIRKPAMQQTGKLAAAVADFDQRASPLSSHEAKLAQNDLMQSFLNISARNTKIAPPQSQQQQQQQPQQQQQQQRHINTQESRAVQQRQEKLQQSARQERSLGRVRLEGNTTNANSRSMKLERNHAEKVVPDATSSSGEELRDAAEEPTLASLDLLTKED